MYVEPLSGEPPFGGSAFQITAEMSQNAASMMKAGKAAGPPRRFIEMVKTAGDTFNDQLTTLKLSYTGR